MRNAIAKLIRSRLAKLRLTNASWPSYSDLLLWPLRHEVWRPATEPDTSTALANPAVVGRARRALVMRVAVGPGG